MKPINLNDDIIVRVTPAGWAHAEAKWQVMNDDVLARTGKPLPFTVRECHPEDENGYSKWSIWQLANTFGEQFYMGNTELPVEMNGFLL